MNNQETIKAVAEIAFWAFTVWLIYKYNIKELDKEK
jgi:hypothetical protein